MIKFKVKKIGCSYYCEIYTDKDILIKRYTSKPIKGIRKFKKLAIQHLDGLNWCSEVTKEHYEAINKLNKDIRWRQ